MGRNEQELTEWVDFSLRILCNIFASILLMEIIIELRRQLPSQ